MLLPEHAQYHKLGPKDCAFKSYKKKVADVNICRNTSTTGEQISILIPIYSDDSRKEMDDRLGMAYSILQDRLEAENKVMAVLNEKQQNRRQCMMRVEKEDKEYNFAIEKIEKRQRKEGFDDAFKDKLLGELNDAHEKEIQTLCTEYGFESRETIEL